MRRLHGILAGRDGPGRRALPAGELLHPVPLIAIVGWQFFGERLDPLLLLGSLFIIGGILFNLRAESRRVAA